MAKNSPPPLRQFLRKKESPKLVEVQAEEAVPARSHSSTYRASYEPNEWQLVLEAIQAYEDAVFDRRTAVRLMIWGLFNDGIQFINAEKRVDVVNNSLRTYLGKDLQLDDMPTNPVLQKHMQKARAFLLLLKEISYATTVAEEYLATLDGIAAENQ